MTEAEILGTNIKRYRRMKGLSQKGLAMKIVMSKDYLSKIELGKQPNIGLKHLVSICRVLDVQLFQLFMEDSEERFFKIGISDENFQNLKILLEEALRKLAVPLKLDTQEPIFYHREDCECEKCQAKRRDEK